MELRVEITKDAGNYVELVHNEDGLRMVVQGNVKFNREKLEEALDKLEEAYDG